MPPKKLTLQDNALKHHVKSWLQWLYSFYLIPGEPFLKLWDFMMVVTSVFNGVSIPFTVCFRSLYATSFVVQYIMDFIYLLDIFIKFHVSFLDRGFFVVLPKDMALHYMQSWEFKFDLFTNIPFDFISLGWVGKPESAMFVLSVIRVHKLLRSFKLVWWFYKEEKQLNAQSTIQVVKFTVYIMLLIHWCACVWYVLACPDSCLVPSWAMDPFQNPDFGNRLSMYAYALYWTVMTITTTGYGDVHATNDGERVWSMITMIVGVFLFGYVSGTIASSLSNLDSRRVAYRQKVDAIKQYMADQNMDRDVQSRVTGWYEYSWERNKGIDVENVFNDLPPNFRAEVALSLNEDVIEKVPFFKDTSLGFRRLLSLSMKVNFFTPDTYVVHRGEIGKEMFFVVQGRVDLLSEDESKSISHMVEGSFFGEYMLVLGHPCDASAVAMCNCDIYVLCKEDYNAACSNYPEDAARVLHLTKAALAAQKKKLKQQQRGRTRHSIDDDDEEEDADPDSDGHGGAGTQSPPPFGMPASMKSTVTLGSLPRAGTLGRSTTPAGGYLMMAVDDQKRIEEIKIAQRRKSLTGSKLSVASVQRDRVRPVKADDDTKFYGSMTQLKDESASSVELLAAHDPKVAIGSVSQPLPRVPGLGPGGKRMSLPPQQPQGPPPECLPRSISSNLEEKGEETRKGTRSPSG